MILVRCKSLISIHIICKCRWRYIRMFPSIVVCGEIMMVYKEMVYKEIERLISNDSEKEMIETTTLQDEPIIHANNKKDENILRNVFYDRGIGVLYISNTEKDIGEFLEYICQKLHISGKKAIIDKKNRILITDDVFIYGKCLYGNLLGIGYSGTSYYVISNDITKGYCYEKSHISENEKRKVDEILIHLPENAKEISGLELMYYLGLI